MSTADLEAWCLSALRESKSRKCDDPGSLSELTVVVPSYGRPDFLLRQAVYWSGAAATLLIADGSPEPLSARVREAFAAEPKIQYLHLPGDVVTRLNRAAGHIRTPYAVLLGDDEFLLRSGLSQAINRLENDPTLVACIGQSLAFAPRSDGTHVTYGPGYAHWRFSAKQDDLKERVVASMASYNAATCYAVFREPFWSRSWGAIRHWTSPYASEVQQAIATYIFGKVSTVDDVYWLRSTENPSVAVTTDWGRNLPFAEWWLSPGFEQERASFVETLAGEAVGEQRVSGITASAIVHDAVEAYVDLCRRRKPTKSSKFRAFARQMVVKTLRAALSEHDFHAMKARTVRLLGLKGGEGFGSLAEVLCRTDRDAFVVSPEAALEFAEVEHLIAEFYEVRLRKR